MSKLPSEDVKVSTGPLKKCTRCGETYGASQFNDGGIWCRDCRRGIESVNECTCAAEPFIDTDGLKYYERDPDPECPVHP